MKYEVHPGVLLLRFVDFCVLLVVRQLETEALSGRVSPQRVL